MADERTHIVTLKDIASELKNIRKVLERMAQAPIFIKDSPLDVRSVEDNCGCHMRLDEDGNPDLSGFITCTDEEVDKPEVAYICDNKACDNCTNDDCMHTTKIEHAWNFEYKDGKYVEVIR